MVVLGRGQRPPVPFPSAVGSGKGIVFGKGMAHRPGGSLDSPLQLQAIKFIIFHTTKAHAYD